MSKHDCNTIRDLGYKSCVPYYIQFDPDLNINHTRLYTLIEQMESNPNPKINPTFSYAWFGSIIGVERREAMRIAKTMKDKGYIAHTQKPDGRWVWTIVKTLVSADDVGGVAQNDTPPVANYATPPVAQNDTLNTKKINYQKEENTKLDSSSFIFSKTTDINLLSQKLDRDNRTDNEFLAECVEHVDNHSNQKYPRLQRANALVKLLAKLNGDNIIFRPSHEMDKPSPENKIAPLFTDDEFQLMQEYNHAKKMENWGNDINVYMKQELREKAEELLKRAKAMEAPACQPSTPKSSARRNYLTSVSNLELVPSSYQQGS